MLFVLTAQQRATTAPFDVGHLISDALLDARMSHKEAWIACGVDRAHWSRMLSGERSLDLRLLVQLPMRFWRAFIPLLVSALIKSWVSDVFPQPQMAKAELGDVAREKESA